MRVRKENIWMLAAIAAGVCVWKFLKLPFTGGFISGAATVMLIIILIGRNQLDKAVGRVEKRMSDFKQQQYGSEKTFIEE